jgi:membrane glycosyltransferase
MDMTSHVEAEPLRGSPAPGVRPCRRRFVFFTLVCATIIVLVTCLATVLLPGGLSLLELAMLVLFALNLPWITIGLWNAVIGFALLRVVGDGPSRVIPLAGLGERPLAPSGRVAIVMPIFDEDPESAFRALRTTLASLDATGKSAPFDIFVLSDTRDDRLAREEAKRFAAWRDADARPCRLHYRRRTDNIGFKAGNIRAFCEQSGSDYELMIVLDADSVMSGAAILRMVGLMEVNPRLGILQTLVVGLPSASPFARIFQYGMRHGMRAYTMGSAWWQGDAGPYWGHNACLRLRPFTEHCHLPPVPGRPPLGGCVLSHDQVEAVLMRRAGYDVRVLPLEDGSYEANPPTVLDFIKRDLRWCHGNMQYMRLLGVGGANRMGRLQMLLAILMYTAAPCWLGFCLLGLLHVLAPTFGLPSVALLAEPPGLPGDATLAAIGLALFLGIVLMTWAPKLFGLAHVLSDRAQRRAYGGAALVVAGAGLELIFSSLLAPVVSTAQTIFLAGLLAGRRLTWAAQVRSDRSLTLGQAARTLWPQTVLGAGGLAALVLGAPQSLWWASPMIAGLLLAVPFAMATSSTVIGAVLVRAGVCATPEELHPSVEVRNVCAWLAPPNVSMANTVADRRPSPLPSTEAAAPSQA